MNENYTVYMHRFPNGKVYIGMTSKKPEDRWRNGLGYQTQNVYKAILKYGWENIKHIILFSGLSKKNAEEKEIELISVYQSADPKHGYNIELGGNYAGKHSRQTCEKISRSKKGWNPSEGTRRRMSAAKKGRKMPEDIKKKISEALKGRVFSEETLLKAQKESVKKCSKPILQRNKDGEMVATWKSAAEIERAIGINRVQISRACRTNTICHGYYWVFL